MNGAEDQSGQPLVMFQITRLSPIAYVILTYILKKSTKGKTRALKL
jgi:hypothetical protein